MDQFHKITAHELKLAVRQVAAVHKLLADGASVPFIARYRKEATGLLNELEITAIRERLNQLTELDRRRRTIIASLQKRNLLDRTLHKALLAAPDLLRLEDIYQPHRPRRRTRGMIARKRGLEPLARDIFSQDNRPIKAERFINHSLGVPDAKEALNGARAIIAEWIRDDPRLRTRLRALFNKKALLHSRVIKKNQSAGLKFRDYFDFREPSARIPGHRLLALLRGEREKALRLSFRPPEDEALALIDKSQVRDRGLAGKQVALAGRDSYRRLIAPALENELRARLRERAEQEAIGIFAENLRGLLLAPPLGSRRVMALDPGFRTGAKLVCLDSQGQLRHFTTIYPTGTSAGKRRAADTVTALCREFQIEAIAIGNGTAGRETERFIRGLGLPDEIIITMVDENGASIYSASEIARREFPDHDLTVRGAVSIGRRLQDPLAELVKLAPETIGVGQYQHDLNQSRLKKALTETVISCVNQVGVELNTASAELLSRVSGLGPGLAAAIVSYRNEHGGFKSRQDLLRVTRLGDKAFEQSAGFLRISEAPNPLDRTTIHPEQYPLVERMARDCGCRVAELPARPELREKIVLENYLCDQAGVPTLTDIMAELAGQARDSRAVFKEFTFAEDIRTIADLRPGMKLPGIITNVTSFGAFVDIGVHHNGLIHLSRLTGRFIKKPTKAVRVRQKVLVRLLEVDQERQRISLALEK